MIRAAIDKHFLLMPDSWRAEFSHRLAARVADPRVAAPTRAAILSECEQLVSTGTISMTLVQRVANFFPAAAPPEEAIQEGGRLCATRIEAEVKNLALYAPLSDEEKLTRRSELKAFEREARRVLDERVVGDDRVRGLVAARVAELFQQYSDGIGNPTGIFLNRPLPPGTLREVVEDLEKSFPRERSYVVTGLTGDREADAKKLQEAGVEDLIYDVVVKKTYVPILRASWADQEALKDSIGTSGRILEWADRVEASIRAKAAEQKIEADKLREVLDPPSRVPKPALYRAPGPSPAAPSVGQDPETSPRNSSPASSAPSPFRFGAIVAGFGLVIATLIVIVLRRKPA